jgi:hypothetical protein
MNLKSKIKFFKDASNWFISYFGLYDWEVNFRKDENPNNRASCTTNRISNNEVSTARMSTLSYEENWLKQEDNLKEIAKACFHEVMELNFSKLKNFAYLKDTHISEREIDDEIHRIIKLFENRVFDKLYKELQNELGSIIKKKSL